DEIGAAPLVAVVEAVVGKRDRTLAGLPAGRLPLYVAGLELDAREAPPPPAVGVNGQEDETSAIGLHLFGVVDLLRLDPVAFRKELYETGALVVARRGEDAVVVEDRRGAVGGAVGRLVEAPQELSVRRQADHAARQELDVLPLAGDVGGDDRGIMRPVALRNG